MSQVPSSDAGGAGGGGGQGAEAQPAARIASNLPAERVGGVPARRPRWTPQRPWTSQDFIWWNTAGVLTALTYGRRPHPVSPVIDPVRRAFSPDETMLASADAEMFLFGRGDATYTPSRGFFLAGGPVGLALMAAFFGGQALYNSRKKKAAEESNIEKWRKVASARITVSTHGIYLATGEGMMPIAFRDVQEVQLTTTGEIVMSARNSAGSARWKLKTQWAELIMILWAAQYMPEHPQVRGWSWLPGDWFRHAEAYGYDVDNSRWPRLGPAPTV